MIHGAFVGDVPWIPVTLASGRAVQTSYFILDTGFTGDLQVTPQIAIDLGLVAHGVTSARIANGQVVPVSTALATASMQGVNRTVQILISQSMPLAGIALFTKFGYTALVDCKNRTVALTP